MPTSAVYGLRSDILIKSCGLMRQQAIEKLESAMAADNANRQTTYMRRAALRGI